MLSRFPFFVCVVVFRLLVFGSSGRLFVLLVCVFLCVWCFCLVLLSVLSVVCFALCVGFCFCSGSVRDLCFVLMFFVSGLEPGLCLCCCLCGCFFVPACPAGAREILKT